MSRSLVLDPVPLAVRHLIEGLADLSLAVRHAEDVASCLRIADALRPLVGSAEAIELHALRRADELLEGL